jgi:hypothetical protein
VTLSSSFDGDDFKPVDGWWTFSEVVEERESAQDARNPCK